MLSPDTTAGAFGRSVLISLVGSMNPALEPSAVKGVVVTPIATTRIVASEKTFAAVTMVLFFFLLFLLRLCIISHPVPSMNTMDKRIPLLIRRVTQKNTKTKRARSSSSNCLLCYLCCYSNSGFGAGIVGVVCCSCCCSSPPSPCSGVAVVAPLVSSAVVVAFVVVVVVFIIGEAGRSSISVVGSSDGGGVGTHSQNVVKPAALIG